MVNNPPPLSAAGTSAGTAVLLVIAPFEENAKRIESHLRNSGHKVRAVWVSELADLDQHLQRGQVDLLLASEHSSAIPLTTVIESCRRYAPSLPILALAARLAGEGTLAAVAAGARDLVADGDPECLAHLEKVFLREYAAYRNLRELARTRALLADYESRYAQLIAGTGDAVAQIFEGIVAQVNPAFAALLGHEDAAALAGMPLMDMVAPDEQAAVREHLKQLNSGRADGKSLECGLLHRDGSKVAVSALLTRGEAEGEQFVEMLIRAEARQATGVAPAHSGRIEFFGALDRPGGSDQPRCALFAVIDNFSALEELIGHHEAEQVALQAATRLGELLAPTDGLFRFSTQELAAILTRADALEFEKLADTVVRELGKAVFSTADHDAQLTVSVTIYPLGGADSAAQVTRQLVGEARALSSAGGHRHAILGPTARANAEERDEAEKTDAIRRALHDNRFKLAYQTIASLEGDARQHFDVLVRMINEEGVELHASDFIRVAEKAGMMRAIDRWVVGRALKVTAGREQRKEGAMLFVKLSEETLKDSEAFLSWLQETLKERHLGDGEMCFQFQEITLQNHIRKGKALAKALRDIGASVAIEHFGIGPNSAQLIGHMPINFLKFHSSYTQNFGEKEIQRKMSELMEIAKQRQIKTIVSHVEDANVMARMWQMGVNFIQGYHIQEPEVVMLT